jgi:hypothetical protein
MLLSFLKHLRIIAYWRLIAGSYAKWLGVGFLAVRLWLTANGGFGKMRAY